MHNQKTKCSIFCTLVARSNWRPTKETVKLGGHCIGTKKNPNNQLGINKDGLPHHNSLKLPNTKLKMPMYNSETMMSLAVFQCLR